MIQVNDTVRLITLEKQECESTFTDVGWIVEEESKPQIGDVFTVVEEETINGVQWILLKELYYSHPASKFLKVDKI